MRKRLQRRLIERVPGGGAFFRGRLGRFTELWHKDEPPPEVKTIEACIQWMMRIEAGVDWLSLLRTPGQNWRRN